MNNWGYSTDNILRINCHEIIMGGAKTFEEKVRKGGQVQTGYFFFSHEVFVKHIIDSWRSLVYYNLWKGHLVVPRRSQRIAWLTILIACVLEKEKVFLPPFVPGRFSPNSLQLFVSLFLNFAPICFFLLKVLIAFYGELIAPLDGVLPVNKKGTW